MDKPSGTGAVLVTGQKRANRKSAEVKKESRSATRVEKDKGPPLDSRPSSNSLMVVPTMPEGFSRLIVGHGQCLALSSNLEIEVAHEASVKDSHELFNIKKTEKDCVSIRALNQRYLSAKGSAISLERATYSWKITSLTGFSLGYLIQSQDNLWLSVKDQKLFLTNEPMTTWGTCHGDAKLTNKQELMNISVEELKNCKIAIGEGQFGKIYLTNLRQQQVAVKVLKGLPSENQKSFNAEVEAMALIRHPNIVLFMGICSDPSHPAIITEFMEKGTLSTVLADTANIELGNDRKFKMAQDISCGLAWLHGCRPPIIHRDLKPDNLLVSGDLTVKLCDFGLTVSVTEAETQRAAGSLLGMGTPIYMAPENLLGNSITEKIDVYAFGLIFWEILTRANPFPDIKSFPQLKTHICEENKRPNLKKIKHFGEELCNLIASCWSPVAASRPDMSLIHRKMGQTMAVALLPCQNAQKLWKLPVFGNGFKVSFKNFYPEFIKLAGGDGGFLRTYEAFFRQLVVTPETEHISAQKFGDVLHWFGPLDVAHGLSWVDRIRALLPIPDPDKPQAGSSPKIFFHPFCDAIKAEAQLLAKNVESGLVQEVTREELLKVNERVECFLSDESITAVSSDSARRIILASKKADCICHARITRVQGTTFSIGLPPGGKRQEIKKVGWITSLLDEKDADMRKSFKCLDINLKSPLPNNDVKITLAETTHNYICTFNVSSDGIKKDSPGVQPSPRK